MAETLPLPRFYDPARVADLRFIDYQGIVREAEEWRRRYRLRPAAADRRSVGLLVIDQQYTFCNPAGELYVGGHSGTAAVDDTRRIAEFVYRNLSVITTIYCTLDAHLAYAIFHQLFVVDEEGRHPRPYDIVSVADVRSGRWRASLWMASALRVSLAEAQRQLLFYCEELLKEARYQLIIWPFHGMLGSAGQALVSGFEEAAFFHAAARGSQTVHEVLGVNPWTENYSALGPEVLKRYDGTRLAEKATAFMRMVLSNDVIIAVGEAKSHCFQWTMNDLLETVAAEDPALAGKFYLMEDCTSSVVSPAMDFTAMADEAFASFAAAGMHVVRSTDPLEGWPGVNL